MARIGKAAIVGEAFAFNPAHQECEWASDVKKRAATFPAFAARLKRTAHLRILFYNLPKSQREARSNGNGMGPDRLWHGERSAQLDHKVLWFDGFPCAVRANNEIR